MPDLYQVKGVFYEAEISIPAMVSYEWLQKKELDVCPRLNALSKFEDEQFTTFYGEPWTKLVKSPAGKRSRKSKRDGKLPSCEEKRMAYGHYCVTSTPFWEAPSPVHSKRTRTITVPPGGRPAMVTRSMKVRGGVEEEEKSLKVKVDAQLPCKCCRAAMEVLVDTGAWINLIRKGVIPSHHFRKARHPVKLVAADGEEIKGGERSIQLKWRFAQFVEGKLLSRPYEVEAEFLEAEIDEASAVSYAWLRAHKLDVSPKWNALTTFEEGQFKMLYGEPWPKLLRKGPRVTEILKGAQVGQSR